MVKPISGKVRSEQRSCRLEGRAGEDLLRLWKLNFRLGWPERARGLHYWLGFEYALVLTRLSPEPGERLLDIGSGAYSAFPYLVAHLRDVRVTALDVSNEVNRQREIRERAVRAGLRRAGEVEIVRADARSMPFESGSFGAFTAISALEHVRGEAGDREALAEAARILMPGGRGVVTVPFRSAGTVDELDESLRLWQRHFSAATLNESLVEPSGLREVERVYYGERLPFYDLALRLPTPVDWFRRPWDTLLSRLLMRKVQNPSEASAVMVVLEKPSE
jgi:ubiquinone/menaquinone biosynthesis C-methylase UbiE